MIRELAQSVGILEEEAGYVLIDGVRWVVDELLGLHFDAEMIMGARRRGPRTTRG